MTKSNTIKIEDIGPIEDLTMDIVPGVNVLCGPNGSGKTKAIDVAEAIATGRGKLSVRDGAASGHVDGLGVTLHVGRSTRRTGELDVRVLDSRRSLAMLVDPGLKDAGAADAKRIKALLEMLGVTPDPSLFHALLGGQEGFDSVVTRRATEAGDIVEMARRIKVDIDKAARDDEDQVKRMSGMAEARRQAVEGVDLTAEDDADKLQAALNEAVRFHQETKSRQEHAGEVIARAEEASRDIQEAEGNYAGQDVDTAKERLNETAIDATRKEAVVEELEAKLTTAREGLAAEQSDHARAADWLDSAVSHENTMDLWRHQVAAGLNIEPVPDEEVDAARQRCLE
ncbi:hypothetical protein LCGC14_1321610, partial [marine sediment metagenome]